MRLRVPGTARQKVRRRILSDPVLKELLSRPLPEVEGWLEENLKSPAQTTAMVKRLIPIIWFLARGLAETDGVSHD